MKKSKKMLEDLEAADKAFEGTVETHALTANEEARLERARGGLLTRLWKSAGLLWDIIQYDGWTVKMDKIKKTKMDKIKKTNHGPLTIFEAKMILDCQHCKKQSQLYAGQMNIWGFAPCPHCNKEGKLTRR